MCSLCGQCHLDMVTMPSGLSVCTSKRYCLLHTLRNATPLQITRMHAAAVKYALAASQGTPSEQEQIAPCPPA